MENEELIRRIEALEAWKVERENQQIAFPLDERSIEILNEYFVRVFDNYVYFGGAGGNSFPVFLGKQGDLSFDLYPGLIRYSADPDSDIITISDRGSFPRENLVDTVSFNRFIDGEEVILFTTGTAPGGLTGEGLTTYYVVSAATDGYSFKLSASFGGSAIDITSTGLGRQLLQKI